VDSLREARARIKGTVSATFVGAVALNEAWLAHRRGDAAGRDRSLRVALEAAADARARMRMHWYPNALSELLPVALAQGIEPEMARRLARDFGVRPQPADVEDWPWPVKVRVLGSFELLVDGAPPGFSRKMPRKALALLGAIITFGGVGVPEQCVLDALWPQDEGDAAYRSLTTTLRRLRDILGQKDAVRHAGGKLELDSHRCWVDAWAFEQALEQGDAASVPRALDLYRGGFLEQEEDARWAVPMRERLRGKFIQAIVAAAEAHERDGHYADAINCYSRGLDADNLVETFYQGLMRCYDRMQRRTEALSAYRRLRQVLSVTLGVTPSAATERLYQSLRMN
jgi:DNA-binding SARP family transcriptional activator